LIRDIIPHHGKEGPSSQAVHREALSEPCRLLRCSWSRRSMMLIRPLVCQSHANGPQLWLFTADYQSAEERLGRAVWVEELLVVAVRGTIPKTVPTVWASVTCASASRMQSFKPGRQPRSCLSHPSLSLLLSLRRPYLAGNPTGNPDGISFTWGSKPTISC
jgi:hypothetical protein